MPCSGSPEQRVPWPAPPLSPQPGRHTPERRDSPPTRTTTPASFAWNPLLAAMPSIAAAMSRARSPGRDVQLLTDLDHVRVRQGVLVHLEDVHVSARVAEIRLGQLGERVAGHDGVDAEDVRAP